MKAFSLNYPGTGWMGQTRSICKANINPYRVPLQSDYSNNTFFAGPFTFLPSPRLDTQFISWGYTLNGSTYFPRLVQDVFQAYSYIRRTYPLASAPGFYGNLTPGSGRTCGLFSMINWAAVWIAAPRIVKNIKLKTATCVQVITPTAACELCAPSGVFQISCLCMG